MIGLHSIFATVISFWVLVDSITDAHNTEVDDVAKIKKVDNDTPLTHVPMIMSHDAGSGYLPLMKEHLVKSIIKWTKTQNVDLSKQAECGARAFDARLFYFKGVTIWKHGPIPVPYRFSHSLEDLKMWLRDNPNELLLVLVSNCSGRDCRLHVMAEATEAGIAVVDDCSVLQNLTLGKAKEFGALSDGGSMIVFTGKHGRNDAACSRTVYKQQESCVVFDPNFTGCWVTDAGHRERMKSLFESVDATLDHGLSDYSFLQTQALWQENPWAISAGMYRNSSLVIDTRKSRLNYELAIHIMNGRYPQLNFVEVDAVCAGGKQLLSAIRKKYFVNISDSHNNQDAMIS